MDLAPVDAHAAFAHELVVGRQLLHLRHHRFAVGMAAERLDGTQIVEHGRVNSNDGIARHAALRREILLGECPVGIILIPIPGIGENEALRGLEPERVDIGDEDQEAGELLAALHDAEFSGLLDGVDGVAARVREPDDLGSRCLRLQQERGEVGAGERVTDLAKHLAAALEHDRFGVALERIAEGIVGGEEEPGIAAALYNRVAGAVRQRPGVVDPVYGVGRARLAGEIGGRRTDREEHFVLVADELVDGKRDG